MLVPSPRELDETATRAGIRVQPGDVVVIRSGDAAFRQAHPDWVPRVSPHPRLHVSCLEWFREKDIAAIAWDMMDERPSGYAGFGMGAHLAIPFLGLILVDNLDPEVLAQACREEGRDEFLFTVTPLRLRGRDGVPATRSRSSDREGGAVRRNRNTRIIWRPMRLIGYNPGCPDRIHPGSTST